MWFARMPCFCLLPPSPTDDIYQFLPLTPVRPSLGTAEWEGLRDDSSQMRLSVETAEIFLRLLFFLLPVGKEWGAQESPHRTWHWVRPKGCNVYHCWQCCAEMGQTSAKESVSFDFFSWGSLELSLNLELYWSWGWCQQGGTLQAVLVEQQGCSSRVGQQWGPLPARVHRPAHGGKDTGLGHVSPVGGKKGDCQRGEAQGRDSLNVKCCQVVPVLPSSAFLIIEYQLQKRNI